MNSKPLVTIFTPTYNRYENLKLLYNDLKLQTSKNFVWLVIDDGSTDQTSRFFEMIIIEDIINVKYLKKQNGGKHTAYNVACTVADTELIFIAMDSDDRLKPEAIEKIEHCWELHKNDNIEGLVFLCENVFGEKLYTTYKREFLNNNPSWKQAYREKMFWGEAEYILRTEYAKKYRYPQYEGEFFFNEAYTYMQMEEPLFWDDSSIYIREYHEEGLTQNFLKNVYLSPCGYADYNNVKCKVCKELGTKIKATLFYNVFSILGHKKGIISESNTKVIAFLLYPLARVVSEIIQLKFRR